MGFHMLSRLAVRIYAVENEKAPLDERGFEVLSIRATCLSPGTLRTKYFRR